MQRTHAELEAVTSAKQLDVSFSDSDIYSFYVLWEEAYSLYYLCFSLFLCPSNSFNTFEFVQVERQLTECSSSLKWNKERVKELEMKLTSMQQVGHVLVILYWIIVSFHFLCINYLMSTFCCYLWRSYFHQKLVLQPMKINFLLK